jgi:hypothetical protein
MDGQRIFTVDEANELIPQLEAAFDELEEERRELDQGIDRIKILDVLWGPRLREPANPDRQEFLTHRASVRQTLREIEAVVERRILSLGVRFPTGGLAHGLVDFPTTLDGRVVFLCWKRGESRIQAWHEVDGGFAGRRPLTLEVASRMGT